MSAGEFTKTFYEADYGPGTAVHPIRVQEETLELTITGTTNTPTQTAATNPIRAQVGKGKREIGLGARMVNLEWVRSDPPVDGDIPDGYTGDPVRIPVLTKALAAKCTEGATGTYLEKSVKVISLIAEDVN